MYEIVDGIEVIRSGSDLLFQLTCKSNKKLDRKYQFDVIYEDLNKLPLLHHSYRKNHILFRFIIFGKDRYFQTFFPVALGCGF